MNTKFCVFVVTLSVLLIGQAIAQQEEIDNKVVQVFDKMSESMVKQEKEKLEMSKDLLEKVKVKAMEFSTAFNAFMSNFRKLQMNHAKRYQGVDVQTSEFIGMIRDTWRDFVRSFRI